MADQHAIIPPRQTSQEAQPFQRNGQWWYRSPQGREYALPNDRDWSQWLVGLNADGGLQADKKNNWYTYGIPAAVGSIFAAGPFLQGASGAAGAASGGASHSVLTDLSGAPALGSTEAGVIPGVAVPDAAAAGGAGASGVIAKLKNFFTSGGGVKDVASLAALLPMLASRGGGGGSTPFADLKLPSDDPALLNDARSAYALQQKRVNQTQPAFDALVSQAYGMTPTRYRSAAPQGMSADAT